MAAKSAAKVIRTPSGTAPAPTSGSEFKSTVFEIVFATAVPTRKAGRKLNTAERMTAVFGLSDRVAITVEVALAASWKPLVKSNSTASMQVMATAKRMTSTPQKYVQLLAIGLLDAEMLR